MGVLLSKGEDELMTLQTTELQIVTESARPSTSFVESVSPFNAHMRLEEPLRLRACACANGGFASGRIRA